jgi:hypothetical protein
MDRGAVVLDYEHPLWRELFGPELVTPEVRAVVRSNAASRAPRPPATMEVAAPRESPVRRVNHRPRLVPTNFPTEPKCHPGAFVPPLVGRVPYLALSPSNVLAFPVHVTASSSRARVAAT